MGYWYKRLTGSLRRLSDSEAAAQALRTAELQLHDRFQAAIDGVTGDAVAKLIASLGNIEGAVIQVGSVLLVKVDETIIVRQLTAREMLHWQQNPSLFKDPANALRELQRAASCNTDFQVSSSPVPDEATESNNAVDLANSADISEGGGTAVKCSNRTSLPLTLRSDSYLLAALTNPHLPPGWLIYLSRI